MYIAHFAISIVAITVLIVLVETIARTSKISKVILRKITHVCVSLLIVTIALLYGYSIFVLLGLLFVGVLFISRRFYPLDALSDRASESYGEVYFPLGVAGAAIICNNTTQFVTTVLILGLADTAAYFIGRRLTSPITLFNKTIYGSLAFIVVSLGICSTTLDLLSALLVATTLALCEMVSPQGSDNATVPMIAAVLLVYVV